MTPPDDSATKTPFHPKGMKPPPAVKFPRWAAVATSATTVRTGTRIFQQTATMFVSASQRTPRTLIVQKTSKSTAATT